MGEFIRFKPRDELDAAKQVALFIAFCRHELTIYGDVDWPADNWDITATDPLPGRNAKHKIRFTQWSKKKGEVRKQPMSQPFGEFARAFMRYRRSDQQTTENGAWMDTLRALEKSLIERSTDGLASIERVDHKTFDLAMSLLQERYDSKQSCYDHGNKLAFINKFLAKMGLVAKPFEWKNPHKRPLKYVRESDEEIIATRNKKLLSEEPFVALLKIFAKEGLSPLDQVVTSLTMVLVAAPQRIAENVDIWENCDVWRELPCRKELCLLWFPVKGGIPEVKPVPEAWASVVEEALRRLRSLSEEGRRMARWYEQHPDNIYLPPHLEHLRDREWLMDREAHELIGYSRGGFNQKGFKRKKDIYYIGPGTKYLYNFASIEAFILNKLPFGFPICNQRTGMKFSEAMLVFPVYLFSQQKGTSPTMFHKFDSNALMSQIGLDKRPYQQNIFERHEYDNLHITSKMFRHLLTTMAQNAGMSELARTVWRGSRNQEQTGTYSHMTSEEKRAMLHMDPAESLSSQGKELAVIMPITLDEAMQQAKEKGYAMHPTETGVCFHDHQQEPCRLHRDHHNCGEHIFIKGDQVRCKRLEQILELNRQNLRNAEELSEDSAEETDPWIKHVRRTICHEENACALLRDPNSPDGTLIRLNIPNQHEPFLEATLKRVERTGDEADKLALEMLEKLKADSSIIQID